MVKKRLHTAGTDKIIEVEKSIECNFVGKN